MVIRLLHSIFRMGKNAETSPIGMTEGGRDIKQFLKSHGVERLTRDEMKQISHDFAQHLHAGVHGESSSLATYPSLLSSHVLTMVDVGKKTLVVEMGGTNLYAAEVAITEDTGSVEPTIMKSTSHPYKNATKQFDTPEDFFDEAAGVAKEITHRRVSSLGFVWSFPSRAELTEKGVDQMSPENLTKGFVIHGITKRPVGEQLFDSLKRVGIAVEDGANIAVLNDTVAVLLAGGGKVGGVIGTGFNLAVEYNGQIYNLEAGGFSEVPTNSLTKAVDAMVSPGTYLAEKQVSGKYIGMQLDLVTDLLIQEGFLHGVVKKADERLHTKHLSALLSGNREKLEDVLSGLTDAAFTILQEVATILRDRSAQIAGIMIGTLINETADKLPKDVVVPIEGSFFGKTPGYQDVLEQTMRGLLKDKTATKNITFKQVEQSGIKGAAVAALTVRKGK